MLESRFVLPYESWSSLLVEDGPRIQAQLPSDRKSQLKPRRGGGVRSFAPPIRPSRIDDWVVQPNTLQPFAKSLSFGQPNATSSLALSAKIRQRI